MTKDGVRLIGPGFVLVLGALAQLATAAGGVPAFVFTGHWTGSAQETGKPAVALSADFTMSGPKTFTGTVDVQGIPPSHCMAKGRARRHLKVAIRVTCDDGSTTKLRGDLNPDTETVAGKFRRKRGHKRREGTFTLTKQPPSPSGAFLD